MCGRDPRLRQYTGGSADGNEGGKKTPSGAGVAAAVAAELDDDVGALDDEAAARLFEELEAKRGEAVDRAGESRDFTTEIRGGRWTMEHRGVAADSERAKAAKQGRRDVVSFLLFAFVVHVLLQRLQRRAVQHVVSGVVTEDAVLL